MQSRVLMHIWPLVQWCLRAEYMVLSKVHKTVLTSAVLKMAKYTEFYSADFVFFR